MLFQPNQNDQKHQFKAPIATTPNDHQSPTKSLRHNTYVPTNPHTHTWVRVKPVCEAVYTASLCFTVCFTVLTVLNYNNSPIPPTRHKPRKHAVFRVSHIITIHHITQMRTLHKHPTYAPTNIDPTYTHQNTPHEYTT